MKPRKVVFIALLTIISICSYLVGGKLKSLLYFLQKPKVQFEQINRDDEIICNFFDEKNNINYPVDFQGESNFKNITTDEIKLKPFVIAIVFSDKSYNVCLTKITSKFKGKISNSLYLLLFVLIKDPAAGNARVRSFLGENASTPLMIVNRPMDFPVELYGYPRLMLIAPQTGNVVLDFDLNSTNERDLDQKIQLIEKWLNL